MIVDTTDEPLMIVYFEPLKSLSMILYVPIQKEKSSNNYFFAASWLFHKESKLYHIAPSD